MIGGAKVVLASGGLSMPKIASDLAVRCAGLGLEVVETSPALVPFTWNNADREQFAELSGVSLPATSVAVVHNSVKTSCLPTEG